ncbi:hypothetical protein [Streptomyces sp. NPDC091649]|uniref:hypothetical protein n=1 Tax=Streptomyces sp. NPDC091649 TaxID=3366004 RepID=UPI003805274D
MSAWLALADATVENGSRSGQLNDLGVPTAAAPTGAQWVLETPAPSSSTPSATTTSSRPASHPRSEKTGVATPTITYGHQQAGPQAELATVE